MHMALLGGKGLKFRLRPAGMKSFIHASKLGFAQRGAYHTFLTQLDCGVV